ncbi:MAG: hypothetical protein ACRCSG_00485, partial [Cellulosilyticaceae bacterium]
MKNLFKKIEQSLKHTCKEALCQTKNTVDQTRVKAEINMKKNELKKYYQKLGEQLYQQINSDDSIDYKEKIDENTVKEIKKIISDIERLELVINEVSSEKKYSFEKYRKNVTKTWNEEEIYRVEEKIDKDRIKNLKFCQHCNIGNALEATHCVYCGEKF